MRAIDADKLIERIKVLRFSNYVEAVFAVLDAPTIDAEAVVRCKDCKHRMWDDFKYVYVCTKQGKSVKRDFYCAHGERNKD